MKRRSTPTPTRAEVEELRRRLEEAEQALEAIRTGQVESLVVEGPDGPRVFSLEGASHAYRVLVEAMGEGAATLGIDGAILYCNARLARMLGVPLEQVLGRPLTAWVAPGSAPALEALLRQARQTEGRAELELVARQGDPFPALLSATRIQEGGQNVVCAVITDLREQRRQERVVASERFARSILEQAADAIVVCDAAGIVLRTSRAAVRLCGRNPLRMPFQEAFPVALGHEGGTSLPSVAMSGVSVTSAPAWMRVADGRRVELLASCAPLEDGESSLGFVITLVDITAQREDEARLQDALRRAEEGQAKKEEALLALREADRNKTHFLAMLSHELRNPLEPIRNCVYILENAPPAGEQAVWARGVIRRQTLHMSRLIDDLLDVTRISRGKIHLALAPVDLREVVLRTVEDHRPAFVAGGVALEVGVPEVPVVVKGDRTRLAQILGNLLQNVVKFTLQGGRAQVVLDRDEGARSAVLRVRDDGVGFPAAMLPRLFEPFEQADETLDRSRGGLGLGLSLVRALAELHGGRVGAASAGPNRGAEFTVTLPLSSGAAEEAPSRGRVARSRRQILVIEDNGDAAESIRDVLELAGHVVEVALSGPEGIERVGSFLPEIVLCDIGLPGMDGYEVARALRSDPRLAGTVLVALSGYAAPDDVARSRDAGFDRHVAKPVDPEVLLELVGAGERARPDLAGDAARV